MLSSGQKSNIWLWMWNIYKNWKLSSTRFRNSTRHKKDYLLHPIGPKGENCPIRHPRELCWTNKWRNTRINFLTNLSVCHFSGYVKRRRTRNAHHRKMQVSLPIPAIINTSQHSLHMMNFLKHFSDISYELSIDLIQENNWSPLPIALALTIVTFPGSNQ